MTAFINLNIQSLLIYTTVFKKVLDEHVSHRVEHVADVARVCRAREVEKYLLKKSLIPLIFNIKCVLTLSQRLYPN